MTLVGISVCTKRGDTEMIGLGAKDSFSVCAAQTLGIEKGKNPSNIKTQVDTADTFM